MAKNRVKISSIVENQVPSFVKDDFPLITEFLSEYYRSQEIDGGSYDLIQNIDQYLNLDTLTSFTSSTTVSKPEDEDYSVSIFDDVIFVESTKGFPDEYGLIKIDDEIITYKSKTNNSFVDCVRGFSGVESLTQVNNPEFLLFSETSAQDHANSSTVENLSSIFLASFLNKTKKLFSPGFENRELTSGLNQKLFLSHSKDFYANKGTDKSFEILFKALYGTDVKVIRPRDFLIQPSDAGFRVTQDLVVEPILGDPKDLVNRTLFQDQKYDLLGAYGSVTSVEKITRNNKEYYILSLDFDYDKDISVNGSIYGKFSIHPKTKLTASASLNAQTIDVDSTVGFPESGTLVANLPNGNTLNITYTSKSITQFYGCSGISENVSDTQELFLDVYAYAILDRTSDLRIEVRIGGVLSEIDIPENTFQYREGENAKIISLGSNKYNVYADNWLFNIPIEYNSESFTWLNPTNIGDPDPVVFNYEVFTIDENNIYSGNSVTLDIITQTPFGTLENVKKTFVVSSGSVPKKSFIINNDLKITSVLKITKNITKVVDYDFQANVQNTYIDSDNSVYVASSSLPNYSGSSVDVIDGSVKFTGLFGDSSAGITTDTIVFKGSGGSLQDHRFLTGDAASYIPGEGSNTLSINKGTYYIKKIDKNTIKLATSRENIVSEVFLQFSGNVTDNLFVPFEFVDSNLNQKTLDNQKIIRKISASTSGSSKVETSPGKIGIFVNGVELLNYKSNDIINYGRIEKIKVSSGGEGYDVINPPTLEIEDSTGSGAEGICTVEGKLVRLDILDTGFDYLQTPNIFIRGGNGSGATAKASLKTVDHFAEFYSEQKSNLVDLTNNTITFINNHKFRNNEPVYYITKGQSEIGGLIENSLYYVSVENSKTIKLYNTFEDSISGISTISLTSYGSGTQFFKSYNKKKILGSVDVVNSGSGYKNNKIIAKPKNIVLETDCVNVISHGFNSGDFIQYSSTGSNIGGLSSGQYIVTKIDDDLFKLSEVGSDDQLLFYKTRQYVEFSNVGSGEHTFKDVDITVSVQGSIGIDSPSDEFIAKVQPIFRGPLKSVYLKEKGSSYGSEEVLNFKKVPKYNLNSGSGAKLKPVIVDGRIKSVLITNPGSNYNSPPEITISGDGAGCILTPVVENGTLKEVKVINPGFNYNTNNTTLLVFSSGKNANLEFAIQSWRINLVERLKNSNQITGNGGIISRSLNPSYGLQYTHAYTPSAIRNIIFAEKQQDGETFYKTDLSNDSSSEKYHSPILGWSYDGSPIYGPYGYDQVEGGSVRQMIGGYSSPTTKDNRPSLSIFPLGFFVEDYTFNGEGDLDESNGRFCKTPEFPNGIYAYFTTLDTTSEKNPKFPYLIGNLYNSSPDEFNLKSDSNQDQTDINQNGWLRYTLPYNLNSPESEYKYLINPPKIKEQLARINSTFTGKVDSYFISKSGDGYKIGDRLKFNNTNTGGQNAYAEVSSLLGKEVESISYSKVSVFGVEVSPTEKSNEYIAFSNSPHNIKNKEIISISGLGTYFSSLEKSYTANVKSSSLILSENVSAASSTGIVTYFSVYGNLNYPNIRENDIYTIGSEEIKILNIDQNSSRIRVLRESGGLEYQSGELLNELPRKLRFTASDIIPYNYELTSEIYFNPSDSLGIGTVGIGTTVTIENPGVGVTQVFVPTKNIYIPNHSFKTGDSLRYFSNGNTPILVSNSTSDFNLPQNSNIFVAKFNDDFIGLSTVKVGIGTTGNFVGVGTDTELLFFNSTGSGKNHSFKTVKSSVISADIDKREVTLTTKKSHGIFEGDTVTVECKSSLEKTIVLKYDSVNDRILVNPVDFEIGDVDSSLSTITIENHDFTTGEKVVYTANSPSGGLVNNEIYYVVVVDSNTIKLSNSYYNANLSVPITLSITSSSPGSISKVNPQLTFFYDQSVIFDLSDSSLSVSFGASKISAFDFILSKNSTFTDKFISSTKKENFDLTFNGEIGFDGSFAKLKVSESIPHILYYTLVPRETAKSADSGLKVINDQEFINKSNRIEIRESFYNGKHLVTNSTDTKLKYSLKNTPEESEYTSGVQYYSTSSGSTGGIHKISTESGGFGYKIIPSIESVVSAGGSSAIILPQSTTIGKIKSVDIEDIGFDYSSDKSTRPVAKFPDILKIEPLSSFEKIEVLSPGNGYDVSPDLIVIDSVTNEIISDVSLIFEIGSDELTILKNSKGFYNAEPKIIPTNNSNGVGINTVSFNTLTKEAQVVFDNIFANNEEFPFEVGDDVFIENVSIFDGTGTGYNSVDYDYSYFKVTEISKSFGGFGSFIKLDFAPFVEGVQVLGTFDSFRSSGRAIPVKDFPVFKSTLKKNDFFIGEEIVSNSSVGKVNTWDPQNEIMKVETSDVFEINSLITGSTSGSVGLISIKYEFDTEYTVDSLSLVKKDWSKETGFLNNSTQRIQNSDYYQKFSYSIRSSIPYETWKDPVESLNHISGFKKFSDLSLETFDNNYSGISTSQDDGAFTSLAFLDRVIDVDCYNDFDLASENTVVINNNTLSKEIVLNSTDLQDYSESVGNRVLRIDDIVDEFSSIPNDDNFSVIDTFNLTSFSRKFILYIQDITFTDEREILVVTLVNDGENFYFINQYGKTYSIEDLGYFDTLSFGSETQLLFYPNKFLSNNYSISYTKYEISQDAPSTPETLGTIATISAQKEAVPADTTETILSLPDTDRSVKVLFEHSGSNGFYQYDELNIVHDGTNAYFSNYGQLNNFNNLEYASGLGTYFPRISGSNLIVEFIPSITGVAVTSSSLIVSLNDNGVTGGEVDLLNARLQTEYRSIASSPTPTGSVVASYSKEDFTSSYYIVSLEDTVNGDYEMGEILVLNTSNDTFITQYGFVQTNVGLGTFGVSDASGSLIELTFTPNPNIGVEVRLYENTLRLNPEGTNQTITI